MKLSLTQRFWSKVNKTSGCWIWTAFKNHSGYGQIGLGRRCEGLILAHRLSWIINRGPIPRGFFVLHNCDNPPCVRPEHLFLGNDQDNSNDKLKKGRGNYGERNGRAKLTKFESDEIRCLSNSGIPLHIIAEAYNTTQSNVSMIKTGRSWATFLQKSKPIQPLQ